MYETQIEAGMAWMDEHDVPEWKSLINLGELVMARKDACLLGQRFTAQAVKDQIGDPWTWNGFDWAMAHFELSEEDIIRLGFDIPQDGHYGLLTTEWIEALRPFRVAS
jgi:hypothetical protein